MRIKSASKSTRIKIIFLVPSTLLFSTLISCADDSHENKSENSVKSEVSSPENSVTKNDTPVQIAAFLTESAGNENAIRSYQQGIELAKANNPTAFEIKYFKTAEGTESTLKSLVEGKRTPAVLYWSIDDVTPVAPYLTETNTVGIIGYEVTEDVAKLGAKIYGFGYSTYLSFKQLAKFAGKTLKSYRFAVIKSSEPRYNAQSKIFIEESKSLGNTIVFDETIDSTTSDFTSLIKRAQKDNCDTIFAVLPTQSLVQLIKAIRSLSYKGKVLVGDSLFASDITALGQDAEGIYLPQAWSDDANFKTLYVDKYGATPDGVTLGIVALGYDTIRCLQGITPTFDSYSISHTLLAQSCEGLTGKTQFTGERIAQRRKKILSVKNGQFVPAE